MYIEYLLNNKYKWSFCHLCIYSSWSGWEDAMSRLGKLAKENSNSNRKINAIKLQKSEEMLDGNQIRTHSNGSCIDLGE